MIINCHIMMMSEDPAAAWWLLLPAFTEAVHRQQLQFLSNLIFICIHKTRLPRARATPWANEKACMCVQKQ